MPVFSDGAQQPLVGEMVIYKSISAAATASAAGGSTGRKLRTSNSSEILLNAINKSKSTGLNFIVAFQNQQ